MFINYNVTKVYLQCLYFDAIRENKIEYNAKMKVNVNDFNEYKIQRFNNTTYLMKQIKNHYYFIYYFIMYSFCRQSKSLLYQFLQLISQIYGSTDYCIYLSIQNSKRHWFSIFLAIILIICTFSLHCSIKIVNTTR